MPVVNTKGAASSQGFGEFAKSGAATYIEDVFSTYLYTGTGASQTISNGIDISGKGGMVWLKDRTNGSGFDDHWLQDTARGVSNSVTSDGSGGQIAWGLISLISGNGYTDLVNWSSASKVVSWTFRKQPKFFDVVTYTGDGTSPRTIAHSLGSTPGCIIIKRLDASGDWKVHHRSIASITDWLRLDSTLGLSTNSQAFTSFPNSTSFYVGNNNDVNITGGTFVAYIFAHNAGGFGLTGTDNVITCGSFTTSSSVASVNLGYEPQFVIFKDITNTGPGWEMVDNMRGMSYSPDARLNANSSSAETLANILNPTATGFDVENGTTQPSDTYIYIAIRRGPMKVPTDATKVFAPVSRSGTASATKVTAGFPISLSVIKQRNNTETSNWSDRLRGNGAGYLLSSGTFAELTNSLRVTGFDSNTELSIGNDSQVNGSGATYSNYFFGRAPGFFDEVCYTGTGVNQTLNHNLTVAPTLMIIKRRNTTGDWWVIDVAGSQQLNLNQTYAASGLTTVLIPSAPTTTTFSVGTYSQVNGLSDTFVAYLFATCPGVSKVGTYTGTGASQTISCGFTGGARFVLVKRTDITGSWYVWDTARGMVSGTDPSLLLNNIAAEVNANSIYTATGGFQIVSTAADINASGGTYIFLAIA